MGDYDRATHHRPWRRIVDRVFVGRELIEQVQYFAYRDGYALFVRSIDGGHTWEAFGYRGVEKLPRTFAGLASLDAAQAAITNYVELLNQGA